MYDLCCVHIFLTVLRLFGKYIALEPLPSQLNLVIAIELILNAGGVHPLPKNMGRGGVAGVCYLGPPDNHRL